MRVGLKLLLVLLLGLLILCVTIIPKGLSFLWYGKLDLGDSLYSYWDAVGELVFTIIEDEDLPKLKR